MEKFLEGQDFNLMDWLLMEEVDKSRRMAEEELDADESDEMIDEDDLEMEGGRM